MSDDLMSLVTPVGYSSSTCGYCTPPGSGLRSSKKSSKSYGIWANEMTPETYQQLLDRGWRRSGHYIYRPDNGARGTCCPQHAIRLRADAFRPLRSHKSAMAALKAFVRQPASPLPTAPSSSSIPAALSPQQQVRPPYHSGKGKYSRPWDVEREWAMVEWSDDDEKTHEREQQRRLTHKSTEESTQIHTDRKRAITEERARRRAARQSGEGTDQSWWTDLEPFSSSCSQAKQRRLKVNFAPATSTEEKYSLFRKYQMRVHGESEAKVSTKTGFERFLCESPIRLTMPACDSGQERANGDVKDTSGPIAYGLYHMEYRLEDTLLAVGVLDVLPRCLTSVYLFYNPAYEKLQLGKVSALREIALARQLSRRRGMQDLVYYNLGLYVHSCRKMGYKAQYQPAELLDAETCKWTPFHIALPSLDAGVHHGYSASLALDKEGKSRAGQTAASDARNMISSLPKSEDNKRVGEDDNLREDEANDVIDTGEDEDEDSELPDPPPPGIVSRTETQRQFSPLSKKTLVLDLKPRPVLRTLATSAIAKDPAKVSSMVDCLSALNDLASRFVFYIN